MAEKLARKAPCSVLVVPQDKQVEISKVLVSLDFSENSKDAMDVGIAYASAAGLSEIFCLHAYRVPLGYYKTGKSFEEFSKIMHKNAESQFELFIKDFDLKGLTAKPRFVLNPEPDKAIERAVDSEHFDLLVLGSRGRSTGAAVLLGSVTEKLLWSTNIPLLAVKKKGTGLKVLDALLSV
jgi:nucleotide-binding universal stress UspA family protein